MSLTAGPPQCREVPILCHSAVHVDHRPAKRAWWEVWKKRSGVGRGQEVGGREVGLESVENTINLSLLPYDIPSCI